MLTKSVKEIGRVESYRGGLRKDDKIGERSASRKNLTCSSCKLTKPYDSTSSNAECMFCVNSSLVVVDAPKPPPRLLPSELKSVSQKNTHPPAKAVGASVPIHPSPKVMPKCVTIWNNSTEYVTIFLTPDKFPKPSVKVKQQPLRLTHQGILEIIVHLN